MPDKSSKFSKTDKLEKTQKQNQKKIGKLEKKLGFEKDRKKSSSLDFSDEKYIRRGITDGSIAGVFATRKTVNEKEDENVGIESIEGVTSGVNTVKHVVRGLESYQEKRQEKKVQEFIKFLPVLAYDGSSMREIDAGDVLDIAMAGTSATLLAKRWESALLVNVDNDTLNRLMLDEDAMKALMSIEGFRRLNQDIETIINKSERVKKAKTGKEKLSKKEKKEISDEEKEYKSMRKQIQEKLIKFATRIPIFMYLTDYREKSLKDVITQLEPGLFKKVTGLEVKDFELLVSLGVFNGPLMNDAVYKFKRYEDASLEYTGINKHEGLDVGLWDTVISPNDYKEMFRMQQASLGVGIGRLNKSKKKKGKAIEEKNVSKDTSKKIKKEMVIEKESSKDINGSTKAYKEQQPMVAEESKEDDFDVKKNYEQLVYIGDVVVHNKFGPGEVVDIDLENNRILVKFNDGEKMFIFPQAFEKGFLKQ